MDSIISTAPAVTHDDKVSAKSALGWVRNYLTHSDKDGNFVLKAIECGLVPGPDHVGEFFCPEALQGEFNAITLAHWASTHYEPRCYVIDGESDGTIKFVAKGAKGALSVKAHYAVSLTKSDLAKLKGRSDDINSVRGLIVSVRNAANEYIGQKYRRLMSQARKVSGPKAAPREFWTYFADTMSSVGKRGKKDNLFSEAEFKVALKSFETKLKGSKPQTA